MSWEARDCGLCCQDSVVSVVARERVESVLTRVVLIVVVNCCC